MTMQRPQSDAAVMDVVKRVLDWKMLIAAAIAFGAAQTSNAMTKQRMQDQIDTANRRLDAQHEALEKRVEEQRYTQDQTRLAEELGRIDAHVMSIQQTLMEQRHQ